MVPRLRASEPESSASTSLSKGKGKGKSKEENHDVIDHPYRGFDSSASASKSKGKGKDKEVDYDDINGNPESIEDEIAAIERQIDALNERKSELQGTELLDKLEELHKKIHHLAKAVPENAISTRRQALGRSGVDSAGERSKTRNRKPFSNGGSGSREERSKTQTGRHSPNAGSGGREERSKTQTERHSTNEGSGGRGGPYSIFGRRVPVHELYLLRPSGW